VESELKMGRSRSVDGHVLDLEHVDGGYFGLGLKLDGWAIVEVAWEAGTHVSYSFEYVH
jgi:hypothetical protein